MKSELNIRGINSFELKIIAMMFMLSDHMWATVIPGNQWMTNIGRMAFPIFAFMIAEGMEHTHDFKKYLGKMFLFGIISEIPFNMMYGGSLIFPFHQNVLFTFCIALLTLKYSEKFSEKKTAAGVIVAALIVAAGALLGKITMVDYGEWGVLTVALFYYSRKLKYGKVLQLIGIVAINGFFMGGMTIPVSFLGMSFEFPQQLFAAGALIFIWLYNGRLGPKSKWIQIGFYAFYPVHILILSVLWLYVL